MKNKTTLFILQMELGNMANFNYLIGDKETGEAFVIDPGDATKTILENARKNHLAIKGILLTHGHFDHTGGTRPLSKDLNIPVYISSDEAPFYIPDCSNLQKITNKENIPLGKFSIECLHTPGHTPGCVCFYADGNLFTGDTLFIDAIGRTDFPGGNKTTLFKSLQRIKTLPAETIIWPGHNYGAVTHSPLESLIKNNPFLACNNQNDFQKMC